MKSLFICIALFFSYTFTVSQTNLDSLYTVWEDTKRLDSVRIKAFDDYVWEGYLFSKPDSAIIIADRLYEFAEQKNIEIEKATAIGYKGTASYIKGDYKKALEYYNACFEIYKKLDSKKGIASMYGNMGNVYIAYGDNTKAIEYYEHCLKINEALENKEGMSVVLGNIGMTYYEVGDNKKALEYYQKSLDLELEIDLQYGISNSYGNIAGLYAEEGNYDLAIEYHEKALVIKQKIGEEQGIANTYENLGNIFVEKNEIKNAQENYSKALETHQKIGDKNGISKSLISIGKTYNSQGNYSKAINFCSRGFRLSTDIGAKDAQKEACDCLYLAYKNTNNDVKALDNLELSLVFRDSLGEVDAAKKLQKMEFNKERLRDSLIQEEEKLKVEMAHQAEVRKKDRNRNLALGAGLFFLLISGGLYSRWKFTKKAKAVIEKEKDRSENLLLNILPAEVAEELKEKGESEAQDFEMVSILFSDFKGFTGMSEKMSAKDLVANINECFKAFDATMGKYNIEKIKTIGGAYMAAGGLPVNSDTSVKDTVLAALEMQEFITKLHKEKEAKGEHAFEMRVGIHTGPVVAGIVGVKKFQYDIWGDTVNTASRMESSGEIGKINISQDTYNYIKNEPEFTFEHRGKVKAKGKGEVEMYFVSLK